MLYSFVGQTGVAIDHAGLALTSPEMWFENAISLLPSTAVFRSEARITKTVAGEINNVSETLLLPPAKQSILIPNALSDTEKVQVQDILNLKGGTFEGPPTNKFPGIDGWLDGTPVQLKIVTGQSKAAIQRNIIGGAKDMAKAGYQGDLYIDTTQTGISQSAIADFVKKGSPISNVFHEGAVNSISIKTQDGWLILNGTNLVKQGK